MKNKLFITLTLVLGVLVYGIVPAHAATTDTVAASASIAGIATLSLVTKDVSDDGVSSPAKTLTFGEITGTTLSPQYIEIAYASNDTLWHIDVYTDNTGANATALPYGKAGLLKDDGKDRIPLYWCVYDDTETPETLTLDANGVPAVRTTTAAYGSKDVTDWSIVKDKNDEDDPGSVGLDESWAAAFGDGYCDIMYGTPTYSNLNPVPYFDVAPETEGAYNANPALDTLHRVGTTPAIVYIGAGAGLASAGDYATNVGFDLYHE